MVIAFLNPEFSLVKATDFSVKVNEKTQILKKK
jgi:hypothetical protein